MVALADVQTSNSLISTTLYSGLVALFVGATSGIGEVTLKQFAKYARKPRAYFVGRSQDAGDRIKVECEAINPDGQFSFIRADVSLMQNVDKVCADFREKEESLNILFLSQGVPSMDRSETTEHLHLLTALGYYSRTRFITNLLPLLRSDANPKSPLRRVVTIAAGGYEGPLDLDDLPALRVSLPYIRAHVASLISLGLEALAKDAPDVSFVHTYPGTVNTALIGKVKGLPGMLLRAYIRFLGWWICVPIEEAGERGVFAATSARYKARNGGEGDADMEVGEGDIVAIGTNGEVGSGVYAVGWDGEIAGQRSRKILAELRESGAVEAIARHTQSEFRRIEKGSDDL